MDSLDKTEKSVNSNSITKETNEVSNEEKKKKIEFMKEKIEEINKLSFQEESNKNNSKTNNKANIKDLNDDEYFMRKVKFDIDASPIPNEFTLNSQLNSITFMQGNSSDIFIIYTSESNRRYIDFDPRVFDYESYLDFNWNDQAYHILADILKDVVDCINKETEFCFKMTFNSLGHCQKINTQPIRFAICVYIERIFGLEREDYNYSIVNKLLGKEEKTFLKYVACYPEKITKSIIDNLSLNNDEKLHMMLLVVNSKMITQLRFFTNRLYNILNAIE